MKRQKNKYAKDLRTPKYKMRVKQDKRKKKLMKSISEEIDIFLKGFGA